MNFTTLQTGGFADEDLVKDGWTDISQRIRDRIIAVGAAATSSSPETLLRAYEDSDDEKMTEIRARVDAIVARPGHGRGAQAVVPPAVQAALLPRRVPRTPTTSPSAHLVDTDGKGVERIDETGVWVGGVALRPRLPHLRLGVRGGHRATPAARASTPIGRDGLALSEHWADGMQTPARHPRARLPEPVHRRARARAPT